MHFKLGPRGSEGDPKEQGQGRGHARRRGRARAAEGRSSLLVCLVSSGSTSSLALAMGRAAALTQGRAQPSKRAREGTPRAGQVRTAVRGRRPVAATWEERASAVGCQPAVAVPQAAAPPAGGSPMPAGRPAPVGPARASPQSSPQPSDVSAAGPPQATQVSQRSRGSPKARRPAWGGLTAAPGTRARASAACRAAHTATAARSQPPAGGRLVPRKFSNRIERRSRPARTWGPVTPTAASVFTRPSRRVCVQVSLSFQGHRPRTQRPPQTGATTLPSACVRSDRIPMESQPRYWA